MRPVDKGTSPIPGDHDHYRDAFADLLSRLGPYCSYCERRIATNLAVEHIQPRHLYPGLAGRWSNFLLGCVNCNSTKGDTDVALAEVLLPDRDNTAAAYCYQPDGTIEPRTSLAPRVRAMAQEMLDLTGLNRPIRMAYDSNGRTVAVDRARQRMETWLIAEHAQSRLARCPIPELREQIVETALQSGFFGIWLTVFAADADTRSDLINAFPGTAHDCWDGDLNLVSPRPDNRLPGAGKA